MSTETVMIKAGLLNNSHTLPDLGRVREIKHRTTGHFIAICDHGLRSYCDDDDVEVLAYG